jgi:hypothetical protein
MRQLCEDAPERCGGYSPTRFRAMVENCGGDFLPRAKTMLLSGVIQRGLWTLAKHSASDISMEAVVLQEPWRAEFGPDHLEAAAWRLKEAQRRVEAGEPPDSDEW